MKKSILTLFSILVLSTVFSQKIDSLKILKNNDWRTIGNWFDKDTVYLKSIPKIDTVYSGLTIKEKINKKRKNIYGERISFSSGKLKYSNGSSCMVGESLRKINSIDFNNNLIVIDFQIKHWPWKNKEWIYLKREYEIIKWTSEYIILN